MGLACWCDRLVFKLFRPHGAFSVILKVKITKSKNRAEVSVSSWCSRHYLFQSCRHFLYPSVCLLTVNGCTDILRFSQRSFGVFGPCPPVILGAALGIMWWYLFCLLASFSTPEGKWIRMAILFGKTAASVRRILIVFRVGSACQGVTGIPLLLHADDVFVPPTYLDPGLLLFLDSAFYQ